MQARPHSLIYAKGSGVGTAKLQRTERAAQAHDKLPPTIAIVMVVAVVVAVVIDVVDAVVIPARSGSMQRTMMLLRRPAPG